MRFIGFLVGFTIGWLLLNSAFPQEVNPIYSHIISLKPKLNHKYAMKLSNIIHKYTKNRQTRICKINPRLFTAILRQENIFRVKYQRKHRGVRKESKVEQSARCFATNEPILCFDQPKKFIEDIFYLDFGIGQIWYKTAKHKKYKFDLQRLVEELDYSVMAGVRVLCDIKRGYHKREKYWWTRYNASTKSKRKNYRRLVQLYY